MNHICFLPHILGDIVSGGGRAISLGDYSEEWKAHRRVIHSALQRCISDSLHTVIEQQAQCLCQVQYALSNGSKNNPALIM